MIALQFLLFLPFYGIYREDCRQIGKKNLAVPLHERFLVWCTFCPLWTGPIICALIFRF